MDIAAFYIFLIIVVVAIFIKLNSYIAGCFYDAAKEKGFDSRRYFWIPFWFGIVGYLLVVALPNKKQQ